MSDEELEKKLRADIERLARKNGWEIDQILYFSRGDAADATKRVEPSPHRMYLRTRDGHIIFTSATELRAHVARKNPHLKRTERPAGREIEMPPGMKLSVVAEFFSFLGKHAVRAMSESIADYQHEYFEALAAGADAGKLRRLKRDHVVAFIMTVILAAASAAGRVWKALKGAS